MLYRISQLLLELVIRICARVTITGRENIPAGPPFVIISNHSSNADPPLLGMAFRRVRICFLAKKELFDIPLTGAWIKGMDMVCIDRRVGVSGIKDALRRLKEGKILSVFPEGRRASDGEKLEAKKGIGFIVARAKVPVIPVHIKGSGNALPKGKGIVFGQKIRVNVGNIISPDDPFIMRCIKEKNYEKIATYLMDKVDACNDVH